MFELKRDLWSFGRSADAVCVTTNGNVMSDGRAVMGGGSAWEAAQRYWDLSKLFGTALTEHGNRVHHFFCCTGYAKGTYEHIVCFPTKNEVRNPSELDLIVKSTHELIALTDAQRWKNVIIPRPGCGLGGLSWEKEVRPLVAPLLDARFVMVYF